MVSKFEPDVFGPIEPEERAALLARLDDLVSQNLFHGIDRFRVKNDLETLGYVLPESPPKLSWAAIKNRLEKDGEITRAPLAALLSTDWPPLSANRENFEAAVALISAISLSFEARRIRKKQSYQPAIARACHALRMLAGRPQDFSNFPDFAGDLREIRETLTRLRKSSDRTLWGYISALGALIRYQIRQGAPIKRTIGKPNEEVEGIDFRETNLFDESGGALTYLYGKGREASHIPEAGHYKDGATSIIHGEFSGELTPYREDAGKALNRYARRRWLSHAAIRAQYLPCDYRRITEAEALFCWRQVSACLQSDKDAPDWKGYLYCGLLLTTGRKLDRLLEAPITWQPDGTEYILLQKNGQAALSYHPTLPTNEMSEETNRHLIEKSVSAKVLRLPLPGPLVSALHRISQEGGDTLFERDDRRQQTQTVLQKLGKSLERPLPAGRVASFLPASLKDDGADNGIIGYILGESPAQNPALYYTSIELHHIEEAYKAAIRTRLKVDIFESGNAPVLEERALGAEKVIGTKVRPIAEKIRASFRLQRKAIANMRRQSQAQRISFHNAYAFYCYQLLALATGHRPVTAPFEKITDFDLDAGFVCISDKERRANSGRLTPLPSTAIRQVTFYTQHLNALAPKRYGSRNTLGNGVARALSGDGPFLFFVENNGVEALRPANVAPKLATTLPLPGNWQRHHLRSTLSTSLRSELLEAMMGHADFDQEPLNAASGLSIRDLKRIGHEIDREMAKLDVIPIEGLAA
jgi:hypothetical protein